MKKLKMNYLILLMILANSVQGANARNQEEEPSISRISLFYNMVKQEFKEHKKMLATTAGGSLLIFLVHAKMRR